MNPKAILFMMSCIIYLFCYQGCKSYSNPVEQPFQTKSSLKKMHTSHKMNNGELLADNTMEGFPERHLLEPISETTLENGKTPTVFKWEPFPDVVTIEQNRYELQGYTLYLNGTAYKMSSLQNTVNFWASYNNQHFIWTIAARYKLWSYTYPNPNQEFERYCAESFSLDYGVPTPILEGMPTTFSYPYPAMATFNTCIPYSVIFYWSTNSSGPWHQLPEYNSYSMQFFDGNRILATSTTGGDPIYYKAKIVKPSFGESDFSNIISFLVLPSESTTE